MSAESQADLVRQAIVAREKAYARYSNFLVGAALRTRSGKIYVGANVENASYGLTICAERAAVFGAVSAGEREFDCLAIATRGGATPCGACRQVLAEFAPELRVLVVDVDRPDEIAEFNLRDLLPGRFELKK